MRRTLWRRTLPGGGIAGDQIKACIPDCPDVPFEDAWNVSGQRFFETTVEICRGCYIRVQWTKRYACGKYDVFIDRITSTNMNDPKCASCFASYNTSELLRMASLKLLELNPMRFPNPKEGECESSYRVVKGPCWGKHRFNNSSIDQPDYMFRAISCPTQSTCCMDYFEVCYQDGKRIARQRMAEPDEVQNVPNSTICDGISLTPSPVNVVRPEDGYDCRPVCGPMPPRND